MENGKQVYNTTRIILILQLSGRPLSTREIAVKLGLWNYEANGSLNQLRRMGKIKVVGYSKSKAGRYKMNVWGLA